MMNRLLILLSIFVHCAGTAEAKGRVVPSPAVTAPAVPASRPNIIIILSDDQGYGDFSCHGNPILNTPALDQLYQESIRFSNFHVAPLCTPTRGQLLSGLEAMHNLASTVLTARGLMRRDIVTMPEILAANGYRTGLFGKWHLGDTYPDRPMDRGFEKCIWFKGWGLLSETEFDNDYYHTRYLDSLTTRYSDAYCTDLWFSEAMQWMEEAGRQQQPFFAYIALNAPHGPFHAPKENREHYLGEAPDEKTASYYGMIERIDENMARLDRWLKTRGIKDNTLIIYMNDNGAPAGLDTYNAGMRGRKGDIYEGGHRAACFIRWPGGRLGEPSISPYPAAVHDLLPTLIDLLDLTPPRGYKFDGQSLAPVLRDPTTDHGSRMFVVQYGNYPKTAQYDGCVVRDQWRLVGDDELYNLEEDPGQTNNLAAKHPRLLAEMKTFYDSWWEKAAPGVETFVPLIIGSDHANPTLISAGFWEGDGVNTQWAVANGQGAPIGGQWHIKAAQSGTYLLELHRWPPHLRRPLTAAGPGTAAGGTPIRQGKALPIVGATVCLDNGDTISARAKKNSPSVDIRLRIATGTHTLRGYFTDARGNPLCGAYYITVTRTSP